jgi:deazaflavin-dependent oxidoreductase (nitroreductase family)
MKNRPSKNLNRIFSFGNKVHTGLLRMSSGKFANKAANLPILPITTIGRQSGKLYTNPVVYLKEGEDYLISASAGSMDWHPDWYLNLKHMSEAKIEIGDKTFNVQAAVIFVCDLLLPAAVIGGLAG